MNELLNIDIRYSSNNFFIGCIKISSKQFRIAIFIAINLSDDICQHILNIAWELHSTRFCIIKYSKDFLKCINYCRFELLNYRRGSTRHGGLEHGFTTDQLVVLSILSELIEYRTQPLSNIIKRSIYSFLEFFSQCNLCTTVQCSTCDFIAFILLLNACKTLSFKLGAPLSFCLRCGFLLCLLPSFKLLLGKPA